MSSADSARGRGLAICCTGALPPLLRIVSVTFAICAQGWLPVLTGSAVSGTLKNGRTPRDVTRRSVIGAMQAYV